MANIDLGNFENIFHNSFEIHESTTRCISFLKLDTKLRKSVHSTTTAVESKWSYLLLLLVEIVNLYSCLLSTEHGTRAGRYLLYFKSCRYPYAKSEIHYELTSNNIIKPINLSFKSSIGGIVKAPEACLNCYRCAVHIK